MVIFLISSYDYSKFVFTYFQKIVLRNNFCENNASVTIGLTCKKINKS